MDSEKLKHVMKAFILSQFTYCPLVWMLSERGLNNKINHLHEKVLRIAYKDDVSDFKALLEKDNSSHPPAKWYKTLGIKLNENMQTIYCSYLIFHPPK